MRLEKTRLILIALVLIGIASGPDWGADRNWLKFHKQIVDVTTGAVRAEYTKIYTAEKVSPMVARILYQDELGVRLVIRSSGAFVDTGHDVPTVGSSQHSIT